MKLFLMQASPAHATQHSDLLFLLYMYTTHIKACTGVSAPFDLCELNYQTDSNYISMAGKYICKADNLTLELKPNLIHIKMATFPPKDI